VAAQQWANADDTDFAETPIGSSRRQLWATVVDGYRGQCEAFLTTHWSLIGDIQAGDSRDNALIGLLIERYWKPVYCYLRRKGYNNEEAKDLTQGFFHTVVLHRHLVQRADSSKGHFRTFLLHALDQYVVNENAKQTAAKRIPKNKLVSLDALDPPVVPRLFWRRAGGLLPLRLDVRLDGSCLGDASDRLPRRGLETHWHVFREKVVQPLLHAVAPRRSPTCARVWDCGPATGLQYDRDGQEAVPQTLREHVRTTVIAEDQVDDELAEFCDFCRRSRKIRINADIL